MSYAWNVEKVIDLLYNRRAIPAHSPIPPGLLGYDSSFINPYQAYDTALAKKEMALAGHPEGKGLPAFEYLDTDNTTSRQWSEKFVKEMGEIGIKIKVNSVTWPEFLKRLKTKQYQIAGAAWIADYPDPENFLQLLYGPNESPGTNNANYKNPEYDALYLKLLNTGSDEEKLRIINRMKEIFVEDCPWIIGTHRLSTGLRYDWVKNHKYNDVSWGDYKYIRIDTAGRNRRLREQP
jgi:ABC-type transport system substrate-binding protein